MTRKKKVVKKLKPHVRKNAQCAERNFHKSQCENPSNTVTTPVDIQLRLKETRMNFSKLGLTADSAQINWQLVVDRYCNSIEKLKKYFCL